jgi:GNAT superfamily N-acetyltransferase
MAIPKRATLNTFHRLPGEAVQNVTLFERAWHECEELQVRSRLVWVGSAILGLSQLERFEVAVMLDGEPIGAAVLARDPWDVHVGPCMSVFAQYVLPEYRNRGLSLALMRECIRTAREHGAGVLAYTHRTAPWRYETTYRRI